MIDGRRYYLLAISMTDHYGVRFCDMLREDSSISSLEPRRYFTGPYGGNEVYGWATFCEEMLSSGQGSWLRKIISLDDDLLMSKLERRLIEAIDGRIADNGQRIIDKEGLDAAVKALQGMVGRAKVLNDLALQPEEETPKIEITFLGEQGDPVTGVDPSLSGGLVGKGGEVGDRDS